MNTSQTQIEKRCRVSSSFRGADNLYMVVWYEICSWIRLIKRWSVFWREARRRCQEDKQELIITVAEDEQQHPSLPEPEWLSRCRRVARSQLQTSSSILVGTSGGGWNNRHELHWNISSLRRDLTWCSLIWQHITTPWPWLQRSR